MCTNRQHARETKVDPRRDFNVFRTPAGVQDALLQVPEVPEQKLFADQRLLLLSAEKRTHRHSSGRPNADSAAAGPTEPHLHSGHRFVV